MAWPRPLVRRPLALALLGSLLIAGSVRGQGTDGTLADPITSRTIMTYAERLGLSPPQQLALEKLHDEYKREFRVLREKEIAEFLEDVRNLQSMGVMPEKERIRRLVRDIEQLQHRIETLDTRLFDRLAPSLTEEQAVMLPRIRHRRERERHQTEQVRQTIRMSGSPPIDLSDLFFELDLTPAERAKADPIIAGYERQLTGQLRTISTGLYHMYLEVIEAMEEAGLADFDWTDADLDPEEMQRAQQLMQQIWQDRMKTTRTKARAIDELTRRTLANVNAVLPEAVARDLRARFYRQRYPEIAMLLGLDDPDGWVKEAALRDLTDEQRQTVSGITGDFARRLDGMIEDAVAILDRGREDADLFEYDWQAYQERQQEVARLAGEATQMRAEAREGVKAIVGAEGMAKHRAGEGLPTPIAVTELDEAAVVEDPEADATIQTGDQFVPPAIGRRDIESYARWLALDDGLRAVLDELHASYRERFSGLEVLQKLTAASGGLWQFDPDTGTSTPPAMKDLERVSRLREEALAAVRATDDAFFDDLRLVVDEDERSLVDRLRRLRARRRLFGQAESYMSAYLGSGSEVSVDLVELTVDLGLSDEESAFIDPILARYEEATVAPLQRRFEAQLALQEATNRWTVTMQNRDPASEDWQEIGRQYQAIMEPASERVRDANEAVSALTGPALTEMVEALPPKAGRRLRQAYDRKAFPSVYEDPGSVERHLTEALELDDLTDGQRSDLDELAASYRPDYERLSEQLRILVAKNLTLSAFAFQSEDWNEQLRAYQDREEKLAKLRFERSELNFRAISRLKTVLTPEQLTRIGGLPDPDRDDPTYFTLP